MSLIYKIVPRNLWEKASKLGVFDGAPVDEADGFIHFSTAHQLAETANKHFKGLNDLLLIAVKEDTLGDALRYEISRGGDLFPHLYGPLNCNQVSSVTSFQVDETGVFSFSELKE